MLERGYILLHRSLLNWEWYGDRNTAAVFIHLLLTVNFEERRWRGMVIGRGQRLCSRAALAAELHLTEKEVRTALSHLQKTGEVASLTSPQGTVLTVLRYDAYQQGANETASEGPGEGQPRASEGPVNKKDNKAKKAKEEEIPPIPPTAFERFWEMYPRKRSKKDAEKAWKQIKPNSELVAKILEGVARAKTCADWLKEDGKYIPYPATWLRAGGWEDELEPQAYGDGDIAARERGVRRERSFAELAAEMEGME